jgi:amidase
MAALWQTFTLATSGPPWPTAGAATGHFPNHPSVMCSDYTASGLRRDNGVRMFREYTSYDATGLAELVARREVKPIELLEAAIARAEEIDPQLNSINIPMLEIGRERALEALNGPFAGVPFLIKDIAQDYAGVPSTSGSRALRNWVPQAHAEIVKRFLGAGLVIFGKTATPEFALKATTETALWGATRNPWDPHRAPGGSSGGAAAAVAAGIVPMAGASDGGGSIRIPASYCGLFGLRPSRGRVPPGPLHGEFWDGASSEHVLTRSVRDSARMLDAIAGADIGAPFVIARPHLKFAEDMQLPPERLRIGFCTRSPLDTAVDAACVRAVRDAAKLLESLGHHVEEAEPEIDGQALAHCFINMYFGQVAASMDEARRLTGAGDADFELDTRALGMFGRALSAGEYVTSRRRWNDFARALGRFHQSYDLYLIPSTAMPPSRIGELDMPAAQQAALKVILRLGVGRLLLGSGIVRQIVDRSLERVPFTQLSNLTGTPSMSVPLHWAPAEAGGPELPVGVQFVARFGEEATLLRLAAQLEEARPWRDRHPPVW